jgi:hypothetical protein
MSERERQLLFLISPRSKARLEAIAEGRVVEDDPATVDGELPDEQERIEHDMGQNGLSGGSRTTMSKPLQAWAGSIIGWLWCGERGQSWAVVSFLGCCP